MIPGQPAPHWPPQNDDQNAADWMLSLLDAKDDHHFLVAMPHAGSDAELDALEDDFYRAMSLAKDERPDLAWRFLHGGDVGSRARDSHVVVVVHEHRWVGGHCVNGCTDTRDPAA